MIPILDIDIKGTEKFVNVFPYTNTIFIFPPSVDELRVRLITRGTETDEKIAIRLSNAEIEIARALDKKDTTNLIGYKMINGELEPCQKLFIDLIKAIYKEDGLEPSQDYKD